MYRTSMCGIDQKAKIIRFSREKLHSMSLIMKLKMMVIKLVTLSSQKFWTSWVASCNNWSTACLMLLHKRACPDGKSCLRRWSLLLPRQGKRMIGAKLMTNCRSRLCISWARSAMCVMTSATTSWTTSFESWAIQEALMTRATEGSRMVIQIWSMPEEQQQKVIKSKRARTKKRRMMDKRTSWLLWMTC